MQPPPSSTAPTSPLRALAMRWPLAVVLGLLGLVAGAGASWEVLPVHYVGEARVAVGSQSLDARAVAGYSIASQQLASDLARYVNDQQAQNALAPVLGTAASSLSTVAASPIPESSVIRIEVTGTDPAAARQAAGAVATSLSDQVNSLTSTGPQELLDKYTQLSTQAAQQQVLVQAAQSALGAATSDRRATPEQVTAAQQGLVQAQSAYDVLQVQQSAASKQYQDAVTSTPSASGLTVIQPGLVSSDDRRASASRYGIAGLGLGLVLALVIATGLERRRARRDGAPTSDTVRLEDDVDVREHVGRS
ncbi:hypothetical protein [Kineococcus rubinsiae]|uniref:hypothetical protein n=1 Tax=Kineococcus rubinsiae TaxID=2609562 RepID=UPI001431F390|nr:hypothetical protein [Kineococcus rubinsiae]NIZ91112.1 hypothetical protein [Kineococcus rubinsiae]